MDEEPGFREFVRWDAANPFGNPPPLPPGKFGYTWSFRYLDLTMASADSGFNFCAAEIDSGRPVKIDFDYWNPQPNGVVIVEPASGDSIVFYDWGPPVGGSNHPSHHEEWNLLQGEEGIGHAVTGVGYFRNFDPDGPGPAWHTDYIVVHDNWVDTAVHLAIPFGFAWGVAIAVDPSTGSQAVVPGPPTGNFTTGLRFIRPNPFQARATVHFELATPQRAALGVYDASGRMIRTLWDGRRGGGQHAVVWDGRSNGGHPVTGGVYFLRLRTGEVDQARRVVLLR